MKTHELRISFAQFADQVQRRLDRGRQRFRNRNFGRKPQRLLSEVEEELLDVMGWGFLAWSRLQAVRDRLAAFDEHEAGLIGAGIIPAGMARAEFARRRKVLWRKLRDQMIGGTSREERTIYE